ncbi:MAG: anaerobic sulfatase maturase [Anaerovoracaceae bacterium]|jgi:uncharacterized protein
MRTSIELLIKPASGNCNMKCTYCFYADTQKNREVASYGFMSLDVLETIVKKAIDNSFQHVSLCFQGGEPTLSGLDFYKSLIEIEKKHNNRNIPICHTLQTNGYVIDDSWADFFAENKFLIGLSMDGYDTLHDKYRIDKDDKGTHNRLMQNIEILRKHKVEFNILTVVNADIAANAKKVYEFYYENNLLYQQYIPCFNPFGEENQAYEHTLTPELYAKFLKDLFDCWYKDLKAGKFIYNRYFEGLVGLIKGYRPESCGMLGFCSDQYVVEADGSVYPCDFYVLDQFKIGNLTTDSFEQLDANRKKSKFVEDSAVISSECRQCKWLMICRGGCRRDREMSEIGKVGHNRYCEAYKEFFDYAYERLNSF